ncbi:MAG: hypothetical protein EOO48_09435 [Flavobacterium sp.]|nr:MAG: hypothetical protein EOO48_09435 [Flavobacterium sp.]
MKKAERILLFIILGAAALRMAHIPGGAILSILAIGVTSMFYFVGSYFLFDPKRTITVNGTTYHKAVGSRVAIAIVTGIFLNSALVGILFRLMHWPGAVAMLFLAIICLLPITVICIVNFSRTPDKFFKSVAIRSGVVLVLCAVLYFVRLP